MKKISLLLATAIIITILSGCGQQTAITNDEATAEQNPSLLDAVDEEYARAIEYGFLPDALLEADPEDTVVTWAQYCDMLGRMISEKDPDAYSSWQEMTDGAPDTQMRRDGAMVALLFAAKEIGYATFNQEPPEAFGDYASRVWEVVSMDYPVFDWDTPIDLGEGCSDNNHVGPAYDFCLRRVSVQSGKSLLEFDENNDLRLEQPLVLLDAVHSVVRLYESERISVSADQAKVSTLSAETIAAAENMETVSSSSIPAWRGTSVAICDMMACHGRPLAAEEDIAQFADMGFNYLRLMLLWTDFCWQEDGTLIFYPEVLENIDRILEWCIKYDIHLCIDMHELPGYGFDVRNVLEDSLGRETSILIWDVFSARYADVPSGALSYNLVNEPDASYFSDQDYAAFATELIAVIEKNDRTDKLLVSDGILDGDVSKGFAWSDACPTRPIQGLDNSVMQTMHLYPWNGGARAGYMSLLQWPYESAVGVNNYIGNSPLLIRGEFPAGTRVTLHVSTVYNEDEDIRCLADGECVYSLQREFEPGKDNCKFMDEGGAEFDLAQHNGLVLDFSLSQPCSEISIGNNLCVSDIFLRIPSDTESTYLVPDNEKENGFVCETGKYGTVYIRTATA